MLQFLAIHAKTQTQQTQNGFQYNTFRPALRRPERGTQSRAQAPGCRSCIDCSGSRCAALIESQQDTIAANRCQRAPAAYRGGPQCSAGRRVGTGQRPRQLHRYRSRAGISTGRKRSVRDRSTARAIDRYGSAAATGRGNADAAPRLPRDHTAAPTYPGCHNRPNRRALTSRQIGRIQTGHASCCSGAVTPGRPTRAAGAGGSGSQGICGATRSIQQPAKCH